MSEQTIQNAQLPDAITKPSAWLGADMARNPDAWLYQLTVEDVRDLESAATHFQSLGIDVGEASGVPRCVLARQCPPLRTNT